MLLPDRVAVVTGGAGLIGRGIVETLAREGASVIVVDRDAEGCTNLLRTLKEQGIDRVAAVPGDVTEEEDVACIVADAERSFGQVGVLVNCAGQYANRALIDMTVEEWDRVFARNARSTMLMGRAYARQWIERGVEGAIVNISSGAGSSARAGSAHYASSKAAVNMLTQVMAIEWGPHGIRVNAVAPGVVLDRVVSTGDAGEHPYILSMVRATPMRRTGRPEDVADAVLFLASDRAGWISGTLVDVSGGAHCGRAHLPLTSGASFGAVR
jgi:NAD(P)-dependent dehydrogenase (short-subunit alcohol dehydrogenase family)